MNSSVPREISPIRSDTDSEEKDSFFSSSLSSFSSFSSESSFLSSEHSSRSSYQNRQGGTVNSGGFGIQKKRRPNGRKRQRRRESWCKGSSRSGSQSSNEQYNPGRPTEDWECGICGNLNSIQREECYRCGVVFEKALRRSSNEVCAVNVPDAIPLPLLMRVFQRSLEEAQTKNPSMNPNGLNIVVLDASREDGIGEHSKRHRRDEDQGSRNHGMESCSRVFFRFENEEQATIALLLCHCRLSVASLDENNGTATYSMFFSSRKREKVRRGETEQGIKVTTEKFSTSNDAVSTQERRSQVANSIPKELAAEHWVPPASFSSPEEEKSYLDLLSSNWSQLSEAQKHYYENAVKNVIAKKQETQLAPVAVPVPVPAVPRPSVSTSLNSLKEQIAARKAALASAAASNAPVSLPASSPSAPPPIPPEATVPAGSVPAPTPKPPTLVGSSPARKTTPTSLEEIKAAIAKRKAAKQLVSSSPNSNSNSAAPPPAPPKQSKDAAETSATLPDPVSEEKTNTKPTVELQFCNGFIIPPQENGFLDSIPDDFSGDALNEKNGDHSWKHGSMQVTFQIARRILNRQLLP